MIFGGLFINADNTPFYFTIFEWLSFIRHGYELASVNIFYNWGEIKCDEDKGSLKALTLCRFRTGRDVLEFYGFKRDRMLVLALGYTTEMHTTLFLTWSGKAGCGQSKCYKSWLIEKQSSDSSMVPSETDF